MIKRVKKICKTCKLPKYIFSKGNCASCANIGYAKKSYTKKKKVNTSTLEKIKDSLYAQCRKLEVCDNKGYLHCYICGESIHIRYSHLMHYVSRQKKPVRFNDINCHAGCFICNVVKRGNLVLYREKLVRDYGEEAVLEVEQMAHNKHRYSAAKLQEDIAELKIKKATLKRRKLIQ